MWTVNTKFFALPVCLLAMALQGCGDPQTASKRNFEEAFASHMEDAERRASGLCYRLESYKPELGQVHFTNVGGQNREEPAIIRVYDAMARGGVFETSTKEETSGFFPGIAYTYPLSEQGKALVVESDGRNLLGGRVPYYSLCVGQLTLDEVVRWTEPAAEMGMTMSLVTYRVRFEGLPDWTRDPELVKARPEQGKKAAEPFEMEVMLVLTSDGWRPG